ncbi:MAG: PPC domain-containing protein [Anaerolineae bacterium]|nr:PPC domain-containing protein [Anaerolineae bacterium]
MRYRFFSIFIIIAGFGVSLVSAQGDSYSGRLGSNNPGDDYNFVLKAGESVLIVAEATSGDLDTIITLEDPNGTVVGENDDRNDDSLDSVLGFTATIGGTYTLTIRNYDGQSNSGSYSLTITVGDSSVLEPLNELTALELSGPQQLIDTEHFRIHYTLRGEDETTEAFAQEVAKTMEEIWRIQIEQQGWPAPISDGLMGGDGRLDVYLKDLLDGDGSGALGITRPGDLYGDNPSTVAIEQYASSSLILLDNDFEEIADKDYPAVRYMRATAAHEFHHAIQQGYDAADPFTWYYEATAAWMETQTFPKDQDATDYVSYNYEYPELCFGTENDPAEGLLMYGEWTFLQSLVDAHGRKVMPQLWENMALYDGFETLESALLPYDDTVPGALARYRLQNIVRDYKFATFFDSDTILWMEDSINSTGRWRPDGEGVQELGANYYELDLNAGAFTVDLAGDNGQLELWALGVRDEEAEAFALGRGGIVNTAGFDHVYLMVFNPDYDNNLNNCRYAEYTLQVGAGNEDMPPATYTFNARYFAPLKS